MNLELTDCFPVTADELWRGVLAETGAGGRKGRGKRTKRKLKRDLNRGQKIGEGEKHCNVRPVFCVWSSRLETVSMLKSSCSKRCNLWLSAITHAGRGGFLWPGLNSPVTKDGAGLRISRRGEAEQQEVQTALGTTAETVKSDFRK